MRIKNTFLLLFFFINACLVLGQEKAHNFSVDYIGKELTEEEFEAFAERERNRIDEIKTKQTVLVEKLSKNQLALKTETTLSLEGVAYPEDLLYNSLKTGVISKSELLAQLSTLDNYTKTSLLNKFPSEPLEKLYGDKPFIDSLTYHFRSLNKSTSSIYEYELMLKAFLRYPGYSELIEKEIYSFDFAQEYPSISLGNLLLAYTFTNTFDDSRKLLRFVLENLKDGKSYGFVSSEQSNIFEVLYTKSSINEKKLIIEDLIYYLDKAPIQEFYSHRELLSNDSSEEFKSLLKNKLKAVKAIKNTESRNNSLNDFNNYYLPHYARNYGFDSIELIDSLMQVAEGQKKYDENKVNFKLSDYKIRNNTRYALVALKEFVRTVQLDNNQKSTIYKRLEKYKLQNVIENSYSDKYYMYYLDILQMMYPEKSLDEFSSITSTIWKKYSVNEYWDKTKYSVDKLDEYLLDFKKLGFDTNISELDKINYKKKYRGRNDVFVIVGIFALFDNSLWYDCETGIIPNDYSSLISQYLVLCKKELKGYFPICSFKRSNNELTYSSIITNGDTGYKVSPRDFGDWYDPISIEVLMNSALKSVNTPKRFVQVSTGGQAVLSIYIEPYKLVYLSSKYNFEVQN